MPRGFEEYDGCTPNAESRLKWLVLELMAHTTPEHPITAGKIEIKTTWGGIWDATEGKMVGERKGLRGVEVRAMVNYLRQEWKYPIGSGAKGYYWCSIHEELATTIGHLNDRINAIMDARDGLKEATMNVDPHTILEVPKPGQQSFIRDFSTIGDMAGKALGHETED